MSDDPNDFPTEDEIEDMLTRLAAEYGLDVKIDVTLVDNTITTESEEDTS